MNERDTTPHPSRHGRAGTLLFLGASVSQLPAILRARKAGYTVVAVDGEPDAIAFEHADIAEPVDFTSTASNDAKATNRRLLACLPPLLPLGSDHPRRPRPGNRQRHDQTPPLRRRMEEIRTSLGK